MKLSKEAIARIEEFIEAEEAMGEDTQLAADVRALLDFYLANADGE